MKYRKKPYSGLTKRELYALGALIGLNANSDLSSTASLLGATPDEVRKSYVTSAWKQADLMLKESEKK